jgi:ABC-type branched-subunit amino acid transport system permease subunit
MDGPELPAVPERPDARDRPRIGVDEWVAQVEERREAGRGLSGLLQRGWTGTPPTLKLALFVGFAATVPLYLNQADLFSFGLFTLLYALLALGLNIVVGYAGLLDLGYVAFYGFGAYLYAFLSSTHSERIGDRLYHYSFHWPAQASIPTVVAASALLGLVLGFPSRRLLGDYLAIVTLFFGQAFVVFVNVADPWGLTNGPNGLADVDGLDFFGYHLTSLRQYFYFLLLVFTLVVIGLHFLNASRTGRAWRALREDPLAAETMSIPVNRLKLMAFAFGAATAGLSGAIFAAVQTGAFPGNFDVSLLITIYAVVILGGTGSIAGVVLGAIMINVPFELLDPASDRLGLARVLLYASIVTILVARLRPWPRLVAVLGGVLALGFAVHAIVSAAASSWTAGSVAEVQGTGEQAQGFAGAIEHWVVIPAGHGRFGPVVYIVLVAAIVVVTQLRGWWRLAALVPTLYLVALAWENILAEQPAVTRLILFGVLLIALMNARPQGLLGTARVEIV